MTYDPHDHDHVVVEDRGTGFGPGVIVGAIIVILLILAAVWYFGFGGFSAPSHGAYGSAGGYIPVPSMQLPTPPSAQGS